MYLFHPFIPKEDILREISETLDTRWIGQASKVDLFEKKFGEKFGYKYCLMMNSCTSALEMAYHLLDLKEGDEVMVPVVDCTAGQMGLRRRGVSIVFADVDDNLNLSVKDLKDKITEKTKAIVAINLGGIEFDKEIVSIAKEAGIPLIADSAQHLGTSEGDYVCYSFQAIKHITTGDGGMLVLRNKKEYERAKKLRWFGIDRDQKAKKGWQAWERRQMTFDIEEAGYKYQPTDIDACFGLAALPYIDEVLAHRKMLADTYREELGDMVVAGGSHWLVGIRTDKRDKIADYLKEKGIETNVVQLRNDIFKVFGGKRLPLENINRLEFQYLYLPCHHLITKEDARIVSSYIKECL